MKRLGVAVVLPVLLLGCAVDVEEGTDEESEGMLGEVEQALAYENAMAPNALATNALATNALATNALATNALATNALAAGALSSFKDADQNGSMARMLLRYVVSCALTNTQSFSFTWTDGLGVVQNVTYWGALGLAPDWVNRAPTLDEQHWITACVGARTNFYGVTVWISMRGGHALAIADEAERTSHPVQEGAFWGNLFADTPWVRSCHNPTNVAHARSKQRDCAAGHWDGSTTTACGMLARMGSCSSVCVDRVVPADDPSDGFASCDGVTQVLTTFLAP